MNNEDDEIRQFERELERIKYGPMPRAEAAAYGALAVISLAIIIYAPLSVAFRWWPA